MAELTCVQKLAEARAALHALMTGAQEQAVSYEGRSVQFRASASADLDKLRIYIQELEAQCGGPGGAPCYAGRRSFSVRF